MYRYKKGIVITDFRMIKALLVDDDMLNLHGFTMKPLKFKLNVIVTVLEVIIFTWPGLIFAFCSCRRKEHGKQPIGKQELQQTWMLLSPIRYCNYQIIYNCLIILYYKLFIIFHPWHWGSDRVKNL